MIYALPGMGANRKMYPGIWNTLHDCTFVEWPTYAGEISISSIAKRIIDIHNPQPSDTLIGCSLGGIVACEIANLTSVKRLILIGSAKKKEEINRFLSLIHPLINLTPLSFIQHMAGKIPNDIAHMFHKSEMEFIRAMCHAIFNWKGLNDTYLNLIRIHGNKDHIIPLPEDVEYILDGGHLITMTNSHSCVDIITAILHRTAI